MSASRWSLYGLTGVLEQHTLPGRDDHDHHEGLAEAVLWLRKHAPKAQALAHLENALRLMAQAREELRHLEEQLTCVARSIEGDDTKATAVAEIEQLDRKEFGDPWLDAPPTSEEAEALAKVTPDGPDAVPWD